MRLLKYCSGPGVLGDACATMNGRLPGREERCGGLRAGSAWSQDLRMGCPWKVIQSHVSDFAASSGQMPLQSHTLR